MFLKLNFTDWFENKTFKYEIQYDQKVSKELENIISNFIQNDQFVDKQFD